MIVTLDGMRVFLDDHLERSETIIIEDSKEKDDLYEIAKAKGIIVNNSRDLAMFKNIYTFPDKANRNGARLPKDVLLKALPGIIGKPVNLEHNRRYVVGFYIDYSYKKKEDMVIAYGIFFKSNFPDEWQTVVDAFKNKQLTTSYEIWCPKNKYRQLPDNTYELLEQEIAGGAILINNVPAFEGCKVLSIAKQESQVPDFLRDVCLNYASKYIDDDLIFATETNIQNDNKSPATTPLSISPFIDYSFNFKCPKCNISVWNIIEESDSNGIVECKQCTDKYKIDFLVPFQNEGIDNILVVKEANINCYQCGNSIIYSNFRKVGEKSDEAKIICSKCKMEFPVKLSQLNIKKTIKKINKIDKNLDIVSDKKEGEHNMELEKILEKLSTSSVETLMNDIENILITEDIFNQLAQSQTFKEILEKAKIKVEDLEYNKENKIKKKEENKKVNKEQHLKMLKKAVKKIRELKKASIEKASNIEKETVFLYETIMEYEKELAGVNENLNVIKKEKGNLEVSSAKKIKEVEEFFKNNALKIMERKSILGGFAEGMRDEDILDDKEYERASLKKKVAELEKKKLETSSTVIGDKNSIKDNSALDDFHRKFREQVDKKINFNQSK